MKTNFINPPASAQPGVYWYFMNGNLSREAMTKDLEAMKEAGISNLIFLEVGIGVPRGPVDFISEKWQEAFPLYLVFMRQNVWALNKILSKQTGQLRLFVTSGKYIFEISNK